jgi:hypothetical protein
MISLKSGMHKIKVVYFDSGGGNELNVYWRSHNGKKKIVSDKDLFVNAAK